MPRGFEYQYNLGRTIACMISCCTLFASVSPFSTVLTVPPVVQLYSPTRQYAPSCTPCQSSTWPWCPSHTRTSPALPRWVRMGQLKMTMLL